MSTSCQNKWRQTCGTRLLTRRDALTRSLVLSSGYGEGEIAIARVRASAQGDTRGLFNKGIKRFRMPSYLRVRNNRDHGLLEPRGGARAEFMHEKRGSCSCFIRYGFIVRIVRKNSKPVPGLTLQFADIISAAPGKRAPRKMNVDARKLLLPRTRVESRVLCLASLHAKRAHLRISTHSNFAN